MKKILIMDDNSIIRMKLYEILSGLGFSVDTVKEGKEAIDKYIDAYENNEPYDKVVIDLVIKDGIDGETTINLLSDFDKDVNIIVSSGYINKAFMRKYNFCEILAKPYKVRYLYNLIK